MVVSYKFTGPPKPTRALNAAAEPWFFILRKHTKVNDKALYSYDLSIFLLGGPQGFGHSWSPLRRRVTRIGRNASYQVPRPS